MTYRAAILGAILCLLTLSAPGFSAPAATMEDVLRDVQWRTDTSAMLASVFAPALEPLVFMLLQEANGEPYDGMVAVAGVALDRAEHGQWPNSLDEVLYQPRQFTGMQFDPKAYTPSQIDKAQGAALLARVGLRPCGPVYWYHATWMATYPAWTASPKVKVSCTIGDHIFYSFSG